MPFFVVLSAEQMSALGQKQTSRHLQPMSALSPKADIGTQPRNVRFVPKADIRGRGKAAFPGHGKEGQKIVEMAALHLWRLLISPC